MKNFIFIIVILPFMLFAKEGYFEPWGKGSDLKYRTKKEDKNNLSMLGKAANKVILFHQNVISPVCGSRSNFRPTSSRYMQLAIQRYGFFKGFTMGCDRLLRENSDPWVYRKVLINNMEYKFDPATQNKYITLR